MTSSPSLIDAINPVIDTLESANIRVYTSMRDLDPPCCFLPLPELTYRFREASFQADFQLVLIVPNTDRRLAIEALSDLLVAVQDALSFRARTARPVEVVLADNSAVVLAYQLEFSQVVKNC